MTAEHSLPPGRTARRRHVGLDVARAFAMGAMVFGHSADVLLQPAVRALPALQTYWTLRGFTAPLFLMVSGWALWASAAATGLHGRALLKRYLPRALTLLGIGLLLRVPLWDLLGFLRGNEALWQHFTGFDALHVIALCLLLGATVLALAHDRWARGLALGSLAVGIPLISSALTAWIQGSDAPLLLRAAFVASKDSFFPLLPWAGYFMAGATLGFLVDALQGTRARALALALGGAALVVLAKWLGMRVFSVTHPVLFMERVGGVLLVFAAASCVPAAVGRVVAPLSRSSLTVYVFHLIALFGFWKWSGLIVYVTPSPRAQGPPQLQLAV